MNLCINQIILIHNLLQLPKLLKEIDYVTDTASFIKCHELRPEIIEIRLIILDNILRGLSYCEHGWLAGILNGHGACLSDCIEMRLDLNFAIKLDIEQKYGDLFFQLLVNITVYETTLKNECFRKGNSKFSHYCLKLHRKLSNEPY